MAGKTVTRAQLAEAVYQEVGLSRSESASWSTPFWTRSPIR